MARLTLRPYQPGDEAAFTPRADFAQEMAAQPWDWSAGPPGLAWALVRGEQVRGLGGLTFGGTLRRTGWALLADLDPREMAQAIGHARQVLQTEILRGGLRRIEAHARADNPAAFRVLQRLGFDWTHDAEDAATGAIYRCMTREA